VASVYSFAPVPDQAVYGACKAFMASLNDALAQECAADGIHFTLLCPGTTATNFRSRGGVSQSNPRKSGASPAFVAKLGYQGLMSKKSVVIPGFINRLFYFVCFFLNGQARAKLMRRINRVRLKPTAVG
jgi:short-subunit dehydrogenase